MQRFSNYHETLTAAATDNNKHLEQLENEIHGTNHCLAGKLLAKASELILSLFLRQFTKRQILIHKLQVTYSPI
jgi:hypothetical protein